MADYKEIGILVLAAGKGTRMQSEKAKVLHTINGRSMISHVLDCAVSVSDANVIVVVGHQSEQVQDEVARRFSVSFARQKELLGTGDAVRVALPYLRNGINHVVVLCGDVPLITAKTVKNLVDFHKNSQNSLTALAVKLDDPSGYGRMVLDSEKRFVAIREEADASMAEKKITLVNSGIYCFERQFLASALSRLTRNNAQKEYYLTDLVKIAAADGEKMGMVRAGDPSEVLGVNTLFQLKEAEQHCLKKLDV